MPHNKKAVMGWILLVIFTILIIGLVVYFIFSANNKTSSISQENDFPKTIETYSLIGEPFIESNCINPLNNEIEVCKIIKLTYEDSANAKAVSITLLKVTKNIDTYEEFLKNLSTPIKIGSKTVYMLKDNSRQQIFWFSDKTGYAVDTGECNILINRDNTKTCKDSIATGNNAVTKYFISKYLPN